MSNKKELAKKWIIPTEGGWSNNPNDPGGATNMGVTFSVFQKVRPGASLEDLKNLTQDEAFDDVYVPFYWNVVGCDGMDWPLCLAAFDCSVNEGVHRSREFLAQSSGNFDVFMGMRLGHYTSLASNNPKLSVFLRGWENRLNNLKKFALDNCPDK